jgi:hypothetical protein
VLWRAEVLVDRWSEVEAAHAAAHGMMVSTVPAEDEIVVTCTWETGPDVGVGAAMYELCERLLPLIEVRMLDFGSIERLAA